MYLYIFGKCNIKIIQFVELTFTAIFITKKIIDMSRYDKLIGIPWTKMVKRASEEEDIV